MLGLFVCLFLYLIVKQNTFRKVQKKIYVRQNELFKSKHSCNCHPDTEIEYILLLSQKCLLASSIQNLNLLLKVLFYFSLYVCICFCVVVFLPLKYAPQTLQFGLCWFCSLYAICSHWFFSHVTLFCKLPTLSMWVVVNLFLYNIPLNKYITFSILNHSITDEHLVCFHYVAIIQNAAMKILIHVFCYI